MEEELRRIERDKITSQFALSGEVTVHADAGVLVTTVPGRKKVYAGKTLLTDAPSVYRILVVAAPVSDANPYGVQIAGGSPTDPARQQAEQGGAV